LSGDLAGSISDTKLSTITTAGKVLNSATTGTSNNVGDAIVCRDANGDFSCRYINCTQLTGNIIGTCTYSTDSGSSIVSNYVYITNSSTTNSNFYISMVSSSTGCSNIRVDEDFYYNPNINTLIAQNINSTYYGTIASNCEATTQGMRNNSNYVATCDFVHQNMPYGAIIMWGTATPPTGFLLCDGSSLNRVSYLELYGVLGLTYGNASSTTFYIPDMREKFVYGYKATTNPINTKGGNNTAQLTIAELPSHQHAVTPNNDWTTSLNYLTDSFTLSSVGKAGTGTIYKNNAIIEGTINCSNTGSGNAFSIMPPYISIAYIIKAY
jgi:microcystin-dependent protein